MSSRTTRVTSHPFDRAFRRDDRAQPMTKMLGKATLLVSEFESVEDDLVLSGTLPRDDAYVVTLHLRNRPRGAMAAEGQWLQPTNFQAGNFGIVDLRMKLMSEYAGPFHYVSFYLTRRALDDLADDAGCPRIGGLRHQLGVGMSDPVVHHLLSSLRPALAAGSAETTALYADLVSRALVTHLATAYGERRLPPLIRRGGLAPWQTRRAKELLDSRLDGEVSVKDLATACNLSARHFARAFRETTGQSPHRWLIERRIDKAKALLEVSARSLNEIALACGFASQSHFTRTFTRAIGLSPGAWRRLRRS